MVSATISNLLYYEFYDEFNLHLRVFTFKGNKELWFSSWCCWRLFERRWSCTYNKRPASTCIHHWRHGEQKAPEFRSPSRRFYALLARLEFFFLKYLTWFVLIGYSQIIWFFFHSSVTLSQDVLCDVLFVHAFNSISAHDWIFFYDRYLSFIFISNSLKSLIKNDWYSCILASVCSSEVAYLAQEWVTTVDSKGQVIFPTLEDEPIGAVVKAP